MNEPPRSGKEQTIFRHKLFRMLLARGKITQEMIAILEHMGLWLARSRPPPKIHDPPVCLHGTGRPTAPSIADDVSQIPVHNDHVYGDPQYSWDDYIEA